MLNLMRTPCDEGLIAGVAPDTPCERAVGRWVLAATILGSSMAFVDGTAVNLALAELQTTLGADATQIQWVIEAYALTLASFLLLGGTLGDRFGRRRVFTIGVVVFAVASAWCGLATSVGSLIAARAVQGLGGALLVPGSLAIIGASFREERRGQAIGVWSAFSAVSTGLGLVLGGWLIDAASWRAIFFLNLPVAAVVLAITYWRVPESRDEDGPRSLDLPGMLSATVGLAGVTFGLIESARLGWRDPIVAAALTVGVLSLALFIWIERRAAAPMMPLTLFRSRDFAGANLLTVLVYGALGGSLFFLPLNLIQVQGYSAMAAGAANLPFILLLFALSSWSGGLVDRFGPRLPLTVGPLMTALAFAAFAVPGVGAGYWLTFFPAITLLGLGMALTVAPLTTTVMNAVDPGRVGLASGVNNTASRAATVLAIAALGPLMLACFGASLQEKVQELAFDASVQSALQEELIHLAAMEPPSSLDAEARASVDAAIDTAFVEGFRMVMLVAAGMSLAAAFVAWAMIGRQPTPSRETGAPLQAGETITS